MRNVTFKSSLIFFLAACACFTLPAAAQPAARAPADAAQAVQLAQQAVQAWQRLSAYRTDMHHRERVGKKMVEDRDVRVTYQKPGQLHMQWTSGDLAGQQILWRHPVEPGKVRVRTKRLIWLSLTLDLGDRRLFDRTRHRVDEGHLGYLVQTIHTTISAAKAAGDVDAAIETHAAHTVVRASFRGPPGRYPSSRAEIWFDNGSHLPVKAKFWDAAGFLESVEYASLMVNPSLGPNTFDPATLGF